MSSTAVGPVALSVPDVHRRSVDATVSLLGSDRSVGLSSTEAADRLVAVGPNELAEAQRVSGWRRLLDQLTERLNVILLVAAVVSLVVSRELKTPLVVVAVVALNAVIGVVQEHRAERSLEALRQLVVVRARVRRDGQLRSIPAAELVPGDVVMVEAGDRVPADGRVLAATGLEVDEAGLTGESQPVGKSSTAVDVDDVAVGDRSSMVHMTSMVTRGRGDVIVTATGMGTEVGRIAGLLGATTEEPTPLQRQLDRLARSLAKLAGAIVVAVALIGLLRGHSIDEVLLTAVALAVAAIPEGLPAVTAVTLAVGVSKMAKRNAIIKRLASVETLGCTSVICSDKTGTLTMNQMTAVELVAGGRRHAVTGSGYATGGGVEPAIGGAGSAGSAGKQALMAAVLCNDAVVGDDGDGPVLVGDPTEGALVVLAAKTGIDVEGVRAAHGRCGEVPFDSARKWMATSHVATSETGQRRRQLYAKGAPDVLIGLASTALDETGAARPISERAAGLQAAIEEMAGRGQRVLALAGRELRDEGDDDDDLPVEAVAELCLLGLVGIVDPARPEAAAAIAEAHGAGIDVKMITGDHAATAAAVARQLGLDGDVVTGAQLDRLDDDQLRRRVDDIAVFARVSPEHKLRIVDALQRRGDVVAMTGDGVNDAPALKRADIGIAMGITGTEVSKEAATMILTDDNFATIVGAVRRGRAIYDNIVTFVRFQLSTTIGFAALFLLAGVLDVAGGNPFPAIAILWVNLVMDGPPAIALGLDPPSRDVMDRRPRPTAEPILTRRRWSAIATSATVMAIGTLAVLAWAPGPEAEPGTVSVAATMGFATFVLFQFFNALNTRSDTRSVFGRDTLRNGWLWLSLVTVLALQVAVTHVGPLQQLFDTTSLTLGQWAVCAAVASSILWVDEVRKLVLRRPER